MLEQPEASNNAAYGTKRHPATERVAIIRRRSRRKADRPPRLMARKPSGPDGPRPALEGENKQTRGATALAFVILAVAQAGQMPTPGFGLGNWGWIGLKV